MSAPTQHSFPAAHVLQFITLVKRWDVSSEELLSGSGLAEAELEAPHARVSCDMLCAISERARELSGEPGIGFYLGLQKRLSNYGYLGFATMNAATLRESLELVVRYGPTVSTALRFELQVNGDTATAVIDERVDLGSARDIGIFSLVVGMRHLTSLMTGRGMGRVVTDIPLPKPSYFDRFAHLLPDARFEQPTLKLHFSARALDRPLLAPDRAALRLARQACERQLEELGFDHQFPARVSRLIATSPSVCSIEAAAKSLGLSTRTLKRRLADQGETFSALLDRERHSRALDLLRASTLTLEEIAEQLHYSSMPNFARAFRRWTGESPAHYRKRMR